MHFSLTLFASALVGFTSVMAAPLSAMYTKCDLSNVALDPEWLKDSVNATNSLQAPSPSQKLGRLVLGVGSQNYSCVDGKPVANGASAYLYDLSCAAAYEQELANIVGEFLLHAPQNPAQVGIQLFNTMVAAQFTVGTHYFKGDFTTPAFEFNDRKKFIGGVNGKVPCLPNSNSGKAPDAYGAVPSLRLNPKPGMGSDYSIVYRLHTAGGQPPATCNWSGQKKIPYSAQYWFYT